MVFLGSRMGVYICVCVCVQYMYMREIMLVISTHVAGCLHMFSGRKQLFVFSNIFSFLIIDSNIVVDKSIGSHTTYSNQGLN